MILGILSTVSRSSAGAAPVTSFAPESDPADHPAIKAMKLDEATTIAQGALAYANRRVPLKAPEDRRPFSPQPWGGFYIGADLGSIGGRSTWTDTIGNMLWGFLFDMVHHRGQISTYLRPMGAKVPAIYGPSADDTGA